MPGRPVPQGSLSAFVSASTGRVVSPQKPKLKAWRALVARAARMAARNHTLLMAGPKAVKLTFYIHAPQKPQHEKPIGKTSGDTDKYTRGCLDAMEGVLYDNDSQVVEIIARKLYGSEGVHIVVSEG